MMKAAILVSALLFTQATAAGATDVDAPPSERISVADLNLESHEGLATLDGRITAAANRVCSAGGTLWPQWRRSARQSCFYAAVSEARVQRDRIISMQKGVGRGIAVAAVDKQ